MQSPALRQQQQPQPQPQPPASDSQAGQRRGNAFIAEDYTSSLLGGPFNRFALALKSNLDNEIDWASARLASATHQVPESWTITHYAPFLIEAILGVLGRARRELSSRRAAGFRAAVLGDTGLEGVRRRATERAELLATSLFNISQVSQENALAMAQDPRISIEATQWLHQFHGDDAGLTRVKAELLDLLDVLLPLTPPPPLDATPVERWPQSLSDGSQQLDPLAQVETCLWAELVRLVCRSQERKLVMGALRLMVQSIAWHPQLAREILELPPPRFVAALGEERVAHVGELVNGRAAELVLSPDAELAAACFELLLNTVRLEAMAMALDDELEIYAEQNQKVPAKRLRRGVAADSPASTSGVDSGTQTPIFRAPKALRAMREEPAAAASDPSMLPSGLVSLIALVLQQWMSAASPPPAVPKPLTAAGVMAASKARAKNAAQPQPPKPSNENGPPTEPELREACTWVLLNYEMANQPPQQQQQQQQRQFVPMTELFGRYMIAKRGQTVPRIGRALGMQEIARVVSAVFPNANLQPIGNPQQQPPHQRPAEALVALNLRLKSSQIIPIPAVPVDNQDEAKKQPPPSPLPSSSPNTCAWSGCAGTKFDSEDQALEHISTHLPSADACRWRNCNRVPSDTSAQDSPGQLQRWLQRHVLIHGPFYHSPNEEGPDKDQEGEEKEQQNMDEVSRILSSAIQPLFYGGRIPADNQQAQSQVLRLVLQGVGLVEQLQKWANRRGGQQGERDRVRVWRCGDDILDRVVYVAAYSGNSSISVYASRLLAVISKSSVA
ncbi:hypothetical protein GGF46_001065 [Coemansia sp. RSA 552]|nr:hypothetical protein GGF46_001065 [Coemansia sp. RSA 552]